VNFTTRSKWLIGIAAAVAGYVVFGPKDSDPVEPTRAAATRATHAAQTTATSSSAAPVAQTLLRLAHRVVGESAAGSLFAVHSWYVAPPPPPPTPVDTTPAEPPKPVAPPLPFTFMGSYAPAGTAPVFFLTQADRVYDVHVGDTIDDTYTVDAFANGQLTFTYKPLNQQQQLSTGGAP
jgi:hypothetical protein